MDESGENEGGFRSSAPRKLNAGGAAVVAAAEMVAEDETGGRDEKAEVERGLSMAEIERVEEVMKMARNSTNWKRDAMDGSFEVCYRERE